MFWKYSSLSSFPSWCLLESNSFKFWRKSNFQCILLLLCHPRSKTYSLMFYSRSFRVSAYIYVFYPNLRRYSVFHQKYDVNYRWLRLRKFPSILTWVRVTVNGYWILSNAHFVSVEIIMCFLFFILIWSITLIDLWMLSQPSIPGMNLFRVYNLFYILLDLIHSYFVRNFILVFTSDIGL